MTNVMNDNQIFIGIDPGISRMGIGVIQVKNGKTQVLEQETVETSSQLPIWERLTLLKSNLVKILSKYPCGYVVIEQVYISENNNWIIDIAQVRGMIICTVAEYGMTIIEAHPTEIKYALTGDYFAPKKHVTAAVKRILNVETVRKDDESDALAGALLGMSKTQIKE